MKVLLITLAGLAGGFVAGLLLSEVIGIAGMLLWGQPAGIRYLPLYLAGLSALGALAFSLARRQG